ASCPTGAAQHDDSVYCSLAYRGNPTSVKIYKDPATPANPVTQSYTYDWFGNVISVALDGTTQVSRVYSAATQYSQPDSTTTGSGPTLTASATYNAYTGQIATATDPNGQVTHYYYDFLGRISSVVRPDNTSISTGYTDSTFTTTTTTPLDSAKSVQRVVTL